MSTDGESHDYLSRPSGTDAQLLLDYVNDAAGLTQEIDQLHEQGEGPRDRSLHGTRETVIRAAAGLHNRVSGIRDALDRQGILTAERKDEVAKLSQSLDYIAHVLRVSLANNWGYRITEECAPPEVAKQWNGHCHTIRHITINMTHWAEGMADFGSGPAVVTKSVSPADRPSKAKESVRSAVSDCDRLLNTLYVSGDTGIAVMDLPADLRGAELLTVMDADGLIQFGRRNHCHIGPVNNSELRLEKGWTFWSVTNDRSKPISEWLDELKGEPSNSPIRHHVCLTAKGRVEASRLALAQRYAGRDEPVDATSPPQADVPSPTSSNSVAGNGQGVNGLSQSNIADRITAPPEMLEPAVAELLRRVPETWQTYKPDDLTATQSQALFLLVAAGMVEKRERMRMRFADHPVTAEATITATGEYGGVEALESLFANLWTDWKDAFQSWQQSEAAGVLPAYCERLEPSEWRLTDQGVIARNDLAAPDDSHIPAEARRQGVFDFVLKRGFLKERPPHRGFGALVKMNKAKADTAPAGVNIGNWSEGGDAFAQAFGPMMAKMFEAMQQSQPKTEQAKASRSEANEVDEQKTPASSKGDKYEWLAKAMLMVQDHPDWSDARIARKVGKNPGTLSRSRAYKLAAKSARGSKTDRPQGYYNKSSDDGSPVLESFAPPNVPADDFADRGQPIDGSRYFHEYCAECDDAMRVAKEKVGTKPLCDHCAKYSRNVARNGIE